MSKAKTGMEMTGNLLLGFWGWSHCWGMGLDLYPNGRALTHRVGSFLKIGTPASCWGGGRARHGVSAAKGGWNFSGLWSIWAQGLKQVCKEPHQARLPHALCPLRADEDGDSSLPRLLTQ